MKKLQTGFFVFLFVVCMVFVNGCKKDAATNSKLQLAVEDKNTLNSAAAKPAGGNITVAGGGTTEEFGYKTTYEFNAVQSGGKTTGHIILKFRAAGGSLYIEVDCLRLFDGNKATLSGVITQLRAHPNSNPDFNPPPPYIFVGGRVSLTVEDNGEGGSASPDQVSDIGELVPGIPASCADEWLVYLPLDGNVQINN